MDLDFMIIAVGTESRLKLRSVKDALEVLNIDAEYVSFNAKSLVSNQPVGFEEMSTGAYNRAKEALDNVDGSTVGIGIENGLFNIKDIDSWFDAPMICVLTKDDKRYFSIGTGYNVPKWIINKIFKDNIEFGFIIQEIDKDAEKDPINYFTEGALKREEILTQAIVCALNNMTKSHRYLEPRGQN